MMTANANANFNFTELWHVGLVSWGWLEKEKCTKNVEC